MKSVVSRMIISAAHRILYAVNRPAKGKDVEKKSESVEVKS